MIFKQLGRYRSSYPTQASGGGGYQPRRGNPYDDREYEMAEVKDSRTNLTAGLDDMPAFYREVCATLPPAEARL
jgi:hypothetical protein